jgi:hypothetical protein
MCCLAGTIECLCESVARFVARRLIHVNERSGLSLAEIVSLPSFGKVLVLGPTQGG